MAKLDVLNLEGTTVDSIELNDNVFAIEANKQALFDAIIMQRASLRQGTHNTKNRSSVRGGGAKPWRQKGTGRARQGTIRAPQWRGGGVVFGPTTRNYGYKLNKKVRKLALLSALSNKLNEGRLIVVEDITMDSPKTKTMKTAFSKLNAERKPLLITSDYNENVFLSTRNIEGALNLDVDGINVLDVVNAHSLILTTSAVKKIEEALA